MESLKDKRLIRILGLLLLWSFIIILLGLVIYYRKIDIPHYYRDKFIDAVVSSFITFLIFNIIYEVFAKNQLLKELQLVVIKAFVDKSDGLKRLDKDEKEDIIKNSIISIINEEKGKLVFDALVEPYLDGKYNFRRDFNYQINIKDLKENLTISNDSNFISPNDYYLIHQNISYSRTYHGEITKQLCVGFAFDEATLDAWMSQDKFFFRELLSLKKEHLALLITLDEHELLTLLKDFFDFSAFYYCDENANRVDWDFISVTKDQSGFVICFDLANLNKNLCLENKQKFKINFRMPQLKTCRHFLITIPEPTEKPQIRFEYNDNMRNVTPFTFFSNTINRDFKEITHNTVSLNIKKWVFPKSGVIFTWDKER